MKAKHFTIDFINQRIYPLGSSFFLKTVQSRFIGIYLPLLLHFFLFNILLFINKNLRENNVSSFTYKNLDSFYVTQVDRLKTDLWKTVETVKRNKVLYVNPRLKSWVNAKKSNIITVLTIFYSNRSTWVMLDKVIKYILNQEEHRKNKSFIEEYNKFLRAYNVKGV